MGRAFQQFGEGCVRAGQIAQRPCRDAQMKPAQPNQRRGFHRLRAAQSLGIAALRKRDLAAPPVRATGHQVRLHLGSEIAGGDSQLERSVGGGDCLPIMGRFLCQGCATQGGNQLLGRLLGQRRPAAPVRPHPAPGPAGRAAAHGPVRAWPAVRSVRCDPLAASMPGRCVSRSTAVTWA